MHARACAETREATAVRSPLHSQRPAPPASTGERPQAAAKTPRGQKIKDAQGGFREEMGHDCGCYPGLNLRASQRLLIVTGLHVWTRQAPLWVTSVAVVFDASSGLLASKPCGPTMLGSKSLWALLPPEFRIFM